MRALSVNRPVIALVALGAALGPSAALAHVKWFEDPAGYPLRTDLILSWRTVLLVAACVLVLAGLYGLQRLVGSAHWPEAPALRQMAIGAPTLLAVQAAIGLVHAAVAPAMFAPNLALSTNTAGLLLAAIQLLIALSFITGIGDWLGAITLILLGPLAFFLFPPFDVLDHMMLAGIGIVVLVIGRFAVEGGQARPWFRERNPAWASRAVAALRIIGGIAILAPALSEKIWNPDLGAAFLADRPDFNFVRKLPGLAWFDDNLFVLAAGLTEGVIGVALASGLLTRVVILGMFVPFNLGVPFLPPQELLGHLPIFGVMYFLLVHSHGDLTAEQIERPSADGAAMGGS